MLMYGKSFVLCSLLTLVLSCAKDSDFTALGANNIDPLLLPFFDEFIEQASLRNIDLSDATYAVTATFGALTAEDGQRILGMCSARAGDHTITLDKTYWSRTTPLLREFLVFHELGHCVLGREHLDTQHSNGVCTSIMHSGKTGCRNAYSTSTRSAYLDELFGVN